MQSSPIETVIFDIGGVLIDWNPRYLFRKVFDKEAEMEYFLAEICTMEWNEQQDAGRSWKEATDILVSRFPSYKDQIIAYAERWPEMLNGPIEGTVDIFKRIRKANQYRIVALTNWSAETFPIAKEKYEFLHWFEDILVSGVEKIKKPDPKIFHLILERFEIDAPKSVFIDDSLRNVEAAAKEGIQTIHFKSPEQLAEDLTRIGVVF